MAVTCLVHPLPPCPSSQKWRPPPRVLKDPLVVISSGHQGQEETPVFPHQLLYPARVRELQEAEPGIPLVLTQNMVSLNGLIVLAKWLSCGIIENALLAWLTILSLWAPWVPRGRMAEVH